MDKTDLPGQVRQTLAKANAAEPDPELTPALRAAAYCVVQFGYVMVWPIDNLEADLALAIQALGTHH